MTAIPEDRLTALERLIAAMSERDRTMFLAGEAIFAVNAEKDDHIGAQARVTPVFGAAFGLAVTNEMRRTRSRGADPDEMYRGIAASIANLAHHLALNLAGGERSIEATEIVLSTVIRFARAMAGVRTDGITSHGDHSFKMDEGGGAA